MKNVNHEWGKIINNKMRRHTIFIEQEPHFVKMSVVSKPNHSQWNPNENPRVFFFLEMNKLFLELYMEYKRFLSIELF